MDFEQFFVGSALLGAFGSVIWSCWAYFKVLAWRVINLIIVRARFGDNAMISVNYYLWTTFKRSPFGSREYCGMFSFVQPVNRVQLIGYETSSKDFAIFWQGWRPIIVYVDYPSGNLGGGAPNMALAVMFIRGTFDTDTLLVKAITYWNESKHSAFESENGRKRFRVNRVFGGFVSGARGNNRNDRPPGAYGKDEVATKQETIPLDRRYLQWSVEQLGDKCRNTDPFSALSLPSEAHAVVNKIKQWFYSEDWYRSKQIPWRLGIMMTGVPGTGKSSLARAVGQLFDLPVNVFDLSTFSNEDFSNEWTRLMSSTPCMILLEDVDAQFDGRKNRGGEGGLTFDCLLNHLSGVKEADGVLVVITTNHPECLDEALGRPTSNCGVVSSTRPGRIDYVLELGPLDESGRLRIAERILSDCPEYIPQIVVDGCGDTGAQFENRCQQLALAEYWKSDRDLAKPAELVDLSSKPTYTNSTESNALVSGSSFHSL